eukprot:gene5175-6443_t
MIFLKNFSYIEPAILLASPVSSLIGGIVTVQGNGCFYCPTIKLYIESSNTTIDCTDVTLIFATPNFVFCHLPPIQNYSNYENYSLLVKEDTFSYGPVNYTFLPIGKECNCNGHGLCNSQLNCICDKGYGLNDCSLPIIEPTQYRQPEQTTLSSFLLYSNQDDIDGFKISFTGIREIDPSNSVQRQVSINELGETITYTSSDANGFSFSADSNFISPEAFFREVSFNTTYFVNNTNCAPANQFINFGYFQLPISNNSAQVSMSIKDITHLSEDDIYEFIISITRDTPTGNFSNVKARTTQNQAIVIYDTETNDYLELTPSLNLVELPRPSSDSSNITITNNRIGPITKILTPDDISSLPDFYYPNTIHISIQIPVKTAFKSFSISSTFNLYRSSLATPSTSPSSETTSSSAAIVDDNSIPKPSSIEINNGCTNYYNNNNNLFISMLISTILFYISIF